ncbi:hypothetical protein ScPMuIL_014001 [Solemya velum]
MFPALQLSPCGLTTTLSFDGGHFYYAFSLIQHLGHRTFLRIQDKVRERRYQNFVFSAQKQRVNIKEYHLTQSLDHFNPSFEKVFQQKYYIIDDYFKDPTGPVFLYIAGEGALSTGEAGYGEHVELAEKYGALVVAVEHRFYGSSINTDGLQLESLQYLSSQQALADLAEVHSQVTKDFKLANNTWISFGGSYAGALTSWFRLKYPHLVYGAIASSAPVRAELLFEEYMNVDAASLADPVVGGSKQCLDNVMTAFQKVDMELDMRRYTTVASDFKSCGNLTSPADRSEFTSNLAGSIIGTIQYNNELPGFNISIICQTMTAQDTPYMNLIALNNAFLKAQGTSCVDSSFDDYVKMVANTIVDKGATGVGIRQWTFQTCAQFGYMQTCDRGTKCPFSTYMSEKYSDLKLCNDLFKLQKMFVADNIEFTNEYYGSDQPKGSRVVFVNGSIDPWHSLSVLKDLSETEMAVFINGTAHCANMQPSRPDDLPSLTQARQKISAQVGKWLQEAQFEKH